jgi:hypothetical protein
MFTSHPTNKCVAEVEYPDRRESTLIYIDREEEPDDDWGENTKHKLIEGAIEMIKRKKHLTRKEEDQIMQALQENYAPRSARLKDIYELGKSYINANEAKDVYNKKAEFTPLLLPDKKESFMNVWNVIGQSGSGKSTFCNKVLKKFIQFFPKSKIYVFSRKEYDENLDKGLEDNMVRVPTDETFLELDLTVEGLAGDEECPNVLLFDDYSLITNKAVREAVKDFLYGAVEVGRQYFVHIMICRHELLTGLKDRILLTEATGLVIFPEHTARNQTEEVLVKKFGLDTSQFKKIMKLPSRWVYISKSYPRYVVYEHGIYMLK